jgi:hypothetical protein
MGTGPGDIVAGLAPPQDNPPAVAFRRGAMAGRYSSYEEDKQQRTALERNTSGMQGPQTANASIAADVSSEKDSATDQPQSGGEGDSPGFVPADVGSMPGYIQASWARNKRARDTLETRFLACLWARRGEYDSDYLAGMWTTEAGAGDPIYLPLAASKMRTAEAAMRDLLLPTGLRPWSVEPVPLSTLPEDVMEGIVDQAKQQAQQMMQQQAAQSGQTMPQGMFALHHNAIAAQLKQEATERAQKEADLRCRKMEDAIEKRLQEGGYYQAMADFIQYFCTFPSAVLKGPVKMIKKVRRWNGNRFEQKHEPVQSWFAVHPMDCYPAPGASSAQDGDFIERVRLTRADLDAMRALPDHNPDAIDRTLATHSNGSLRAWLWSDMERRRIEGRTNSTWLPDYQIDGLLYWGSVQGKDLISNGIAKVGDVEVTSPISYYEYNALLIGNEIIFQRLVDSPIPNRPYYSDAFDPVPNSFWGNAIYELIKDCCEMVNACARALNANMALASGPIQGIDMSQLAAGQDPKAMRPLQQLLLDRSLTQTPRNPIEWYQADPQHEMLIKIIEFFADWSDELSSIPKYLSGDAQATGAAETMGGLSMLLGNAAKGLLRAVFGIDRHVTEPTLTALYDYEMDEGEDDSIKGAAEIIARGAEAVLVKEHQQQVISTVLDKILQSPKLAEIEGDDRIANLLRQLFDKLGLNAKDLVPSEEEMQQRIANTPPPQPDPNERLKAQVAIHKSDAHERIAGAKLGMQAMEHHLPIPSSLTPGPQNDQINGSAAPAA